MNDVAHRDYCVGETCLSPNTNRWYRVDARFGQVVELERRDHLGDFQTMRFEDNVWMREEFEGDRLTLDDDEYFVVWGKFDPATSRVGNAAKDQVIYLLSDPSEFYSSASSELGLPSELASSVGQTMEQFVETLGIEPLEDGIVSAHLATVRGRLPNRRVPAMHNYIPSHIRTKNWVWRYHAHLDLDTGQPVADHASYVTNQDAFAEFRTETSGSASGTDSRTPTAAERSTSALENAGFDPVTDRPLPATVPVPTALQSRDEVAFVPSLDGRSRRATVTTTVGRGVELLQVTARTLPSDDSLAVSLVGPEGTVHDEPDGAADVYRREGRSETGSFQTWFVGSPAAGEWTVRVSLADGVAVDEQFHVAQVITVEDSPLAMTVGQPRETVDAGEAIRVGAVLEPLGDASSLDGAAVTATVRAPDGTTTSTPLELDEQEGVYVGEVGTASGGIHAVTASATVESDATTAHRESTFTVDVAGPADYRVPTATRSPETRAQTPTGTTPQDGTETPPGEPRTDPTETETRTESSPGMATPPGSGDATEVETTDGDGPGFGSVAVAGGLAGSAALFRWLSDRDASGEE